MQATFITYPVSQFSSAKQWHYGPFDSREAAEAFLRDHGWQWAEDPSRRRDRWDRVEAWYKRDPFVNPRPSDGFFPRNPGFFAHCWHVTDYAPDECIKPTSEIPEEKLYPEVCAVRQKVKQLEGKIAQQAMREQEAAQEAVKRVQEKVEKEKKELDVLQSELERLMAAVC